MRFLLGILLLEPCISLIYAWKTNKCNNYSFSLLITYGISYMFRIKLSSSGSVPSAFWEMLNWGAIERTLYIYVYRYYLFIYIFSKTNLLILQNFTHSTLIIECRDWVICLQEVQSRRFGCVTTLTVASLVFTHSPVPTRRKYRGCTSQ
jgi:hypothetical protein